MVSYLWWLWDRLPDSSLISDFLIRLIVLTWAAHQLVSLPDKKALNLDLPFIDTYWHFINYILSFFFYLTPLSSYTAYSPLVFGILQQVLEEVSLERINGCSPWWNWWTVHHVGMSPRNTLPRLVKVESIQNWVSLREGLGLHDVQTILKCLSVLLWSVVPHLFTSIFFFF